MYARISGLDVEKFAVICLRVIIFLNIVMLNIVNIYINIVNIVMLLF